MKTYRIILLIAGMLVAGLAINTSFAQSNDKELIAEREFYTHRPDKPLRIKHKGHKNKSGKKDKAERKAEFKEHRVKSDKAHKHDLKNRRQATRIKAAKDEDSEKEKNH